MRGVGFVKAAFLLFAMAFSSLALAATPMEKFINSSFEPDQNVSATALLPDATAYLISADGVETYVYDTASGSAMNDTSKIAALLAADSKNRSAFAQKVALAQSFESSVRAAKNSSEALCMQLTGTSMHDCTDKGTCVLACMSNPNCATPLYSDGFWESILEWTNLRKSFNTSLSQFGSGIDSVGTDTSAIDSKMSVIDTLSATEGQLESSILFLNRTDEGCAGANATKRCFEYCPKIDYSRAGIAAQKQNLASLRTALISSQSQPVRAAAILNASAKNSQYLSTRMGDFASLRVKMGTDAGSLNKSAKELSAKVNDSTISPLLSSLSQISDGILSFGKAGMYRAALLQKPKYDAAYSEVSGNIDNDLKKYDSALSQMDSIRDKANKSSWLIGAAAYANYSSRLSALKANLTSAPVTLSQISDAAMQAGQISASLSDEISTRAAQGGAAAQEGAPAQGGAPPQQKGGRLPCLPAFALLAISGFAVFGKAGRKGS